VKGQCYRLTTPTLGILSIDEGGRRIPVTLPLHAMVTAMESVDGNQFVKVLWDGQEILMFTKDLRRRSLPVGGLPDGANQ
jgi:hypothetical protein